METSIAGNVYIPVLVMFCTFLSFCSMLVRNFSCAMSGKFGSMLAWHLEQLIILKKLTGPK